MCGLNCFCNIRLDDNVNENEADEVAGSIGSEDASTKTWQMREKIEHSAQLGSGLQASTHSSDDGLTRLIIT
jgi:hypothetical protein